jgi:plastocyanin
MKAIHVLVALATASLAVGCSSSSGATHPQTSGSTAASKPDAITIQNFAYNNLTVKPGTTVTITNVDDATHTLTSDTKGTFDTGALAKGKSAAITAPATDGAYTFYCTIHTYMKGTLTVAG